MKKSLPALLAAALFLLFCAPAATAASPDKLTVDKSAVNLEKAVNAREADSPYIIGPQNLIQIKIFGESDMNQIYRVDERGYIRHSLLGSVRVGGLTAEELERQLEKQLDGDYIINPKVTIFVLEYSHFSILGEVRKPGNYELSGRTSVIRAVSIAGGFTPIANQRGVKIIRKGEDGKEQTIMVDTTRLTERGDQSDQADLQAEDVVIVPKSFF